MSFSDTEIAFVVMVSAAVFLLAQSLVIPVFGEGRKARDRLRRRLGELQTDDSPRRSVLRDRKMAGLTALERWLQRLPGMERLEAAIEQGGGRIAAARLVVLALMFAAALGAIVWWFVNSLLFGAMAGVAAAVLPLYKVQWDRGRRMQRFEEQLPDALSVIVRALRAGHPLSEALRLVSEEMTGPIAEEFGTTFSDINYGGDFRTALLNLLERVPSVTVMAMVTSILVQRESGGNLAEILDKVAGVVRGRFRFQRKVRTLSAEARLSAWILMLVPFVLFIALSLTSPDYLPMLTKDPMGTKLATGAFVAMVIGIAWLRRLIRIEV